MMVFQGNGPPWTDCQRLCAVCGWPKMEKTVLLLVIVVLWGSTGYAQNSPDANTNPSMTSTEVRTNSSNNTSDRTNTATESPGCNSTEALVKSITEIMENVKEGMENVKEGMENVTKGMENVMKGMENVTNGMETVMKVMENVTNGMETLMKVMKNVTNGMETVMKVMETVIIECNRLTVALIFFIVILMVLGGAVIYLYLERMKLSKDSEKHYFEEKSQHSIMSCTSATVELRPSNTSRQSTFVASQPLSTHNSHLNHTRNMSGSERDDPSRKHLHPPLSKPPPPSDTQEPTFPISGSLGDVDESSSKKPRHIPSSPPPAPKETPDSMFPKTSGSLGDADHYPADNDDDDDEHDYDYLDINMLKQQMDKEKKAEQRQEQMGKEDSITPKKEEKEQVTEDGEAILSRHDSENSLYNVIVGANCNENEIEMESNL
nr:uncharacterized protein LOC123767318 [Procambarus clarkii]